MYRGTSSVFTVPGCLIVCYLLHTAYGCIILGVDQRLPSSPLLTTQTSTEDLKLAEPLPDPSTPNPLIDECRLDDPDIVRYVEENRDWLEHFNQRGQLPHRLAKRSIPSDRYVNVCRSKVTILQPTSVFHDGGLWPVLNTESFAQYIEIEECTDAGGECSNVESLSPTTTSMCKQRFAHHRLIAFNKTIQEPAPLILKYPAGCLCFAKQA